MYIKCSKVLLYESKLGIYKYLENKANGSNKMKKILGIMIVLCHCIFGNNYEILENNGELFFKYSKDELLTEINNFLDENREILSPNITLVGDKIYKEGIRYGEVFIDKTIYKICDTQNDIRKCLNYMDGKKSGYTEENISNKKNILYLTYDKTGKKVSFFSVKNGPLLWFKNNKLERYRVKIDEDGEIIGVVDYILDKKGNLKEIIVSNPILIKSNIYGEEAKEYRSSSIGNENYYFAPDGKFIKKEIYYKYKPR